MESKEKGDLCENMVAEFLEKKGYTILARNYSCRCGEIDVLSLCDGALCVTEVKSQSVKWDDDEISHQVSSMKRMRLRRTVESYLIHEKDVNFNRIRFDVAVVKAGEITYYEDAF